MDLLLEIDGEIVILELQNINRHNFEDRLLFYSSNILSKHCLKNGKDYRDMKPIRVYAIINYKGLNDSVLDTVNLKKANKLFTKKLEYRIFDLNKVDGNELVNLFIENQIKLLKENIKDKINKEILCEMEKFNLDEKEYKKMEDIVEMMMNETEHYENAFIDGKDEGRAEGQVETQNKIATNMLKRGMKINEVIEITGLSKEDARKLKLQVKM